MLLHLDKLGMSRKKANATGEQTRINGKTRVNDKTRRASQNCAMATASQICESAETMSLVNDFGCSRDGEDGGGSGGGALLLLF